MNKCFIGDCRDTMRELAQGGVRVQTCVTSPPYWGLRDYGVAGQLGLEALHDCCGWATGDRCGECHVCRMVEVFRLVRDVLADDGTLWMNYGDSYAGAAGGMQGKNGQRADRTFTARVVDKKAGTLKPKDLCGIPWRVALALQADGWYLRQDIIWHKPNPMPESVRDRCTKAHEYIFLLAKSQRYYYDFAAMQEYTSGTANPRRAKVIVPNGWATGDAPHTAVSHNTEQRHRKISKPGRGIKNNTSFESVSVGDLVDKRNRRSVWTIPSQPYSEAHFATFPPALIEPCILAGSRPGDIVLDPFFGSGTTGQVAEKLGRQWVGIELNSSYVKLSKKRTAQRGMEL